MAVNHAAIILFFIFAFSSTLALREPIKYKECGSKSMSTLTSVNIEPFKQDSQGRYIFRKGTNVTATVVFTPTVMVEKATVHLYVLFGKRLVDLPVPQRDACKDHNIECPLKPDVEYTMVGKIVVMKNLPPLPFIVQLDVELPNETSDDKKYLYCFQMPVHII